MDGRTQDATQTVSASERLAQAHHATTIRCQLKSVSTLAKVSYVDLILMPLADFRRQRISFRWCGIFTGMLVQQLYSIQRLPRSQ